MITLTESAAEKIRSLQDKNDAEDWFMRLSVETGGCSGMEYAMGFAERTDDDELVESKGVKMVVMLSTMLHSIGVGNMLPSGVRVVCIDINPAVVTKLSDRGSSQTAGIVTDVGLFLHQLATQVRTYQNTEINTVRREADA